MIKFIFLIPFILQIFISESFAKSSKQEILTLQKVNAAALKNYPTIFANYDKIKAAEGALLASKGVFDVNFKQSYSDRMRGFYDGKIYDAELEKQFGAFGSKVYTGYRKSWGSFPDYEGEKYTGSGGELRAGVKFSLLKDRDIDANRLGVILGNLGVKEAEIELDNIKAQIVRDSTRAYWEWVSAGQILQVYENLYKLSFDRQKQLETREKKGDIANIVVIENQKNLLKRKSSLRKAQLDFENSSIYLSLFFRNDKSEPVKPEKNQLPILSFVPLKPLSKSQIDSGVENAIFKRPEIRVLKVKIDQKSSELKYAKNLLKPELDVDVGVSKDRGESDIETSQSNNYANVNFSIPLQRSEGKGKVAKTQSEISAIKYEQTLLEDQIKVEIAQLSNSIKNMSEIYSYIVEEAELAQILQKSEVERFKQGASNFFVVNLREQDLAYAQISAIEVFKDFHNSVADYSFATFQNFENLKDGL